MSQDPENQLQLFRQAVELLGGTGAAVRYLKVSERQVRGLLSGERTLHDGFLGDIAAALIEHADTCRKFERRISPAFAGNLTEAQAKGTTNRGRRTDLEAKRKVTVKDPRSQCQACGRLADSGHAPTCPNRDEPWPTIEAELVAPSSSEAVGKSDR